MTGVSYSNSTFLYRRRQGLADSCVCIPICPYVIIPLYPYITGSVHHPSMVPLSSSLMADLFDWSRASA